MNVTGNISVVVLPGRMVLDKGHDVAAKAVRLQRATGPNLEKILFLFPGLIP